MCGIAGILYKGNAGADARVGRALIDMLDGCQHRGPDSTGFSLYRDPVPGHLRLRFIVGEGDFVAVDSVVLSRQASFDHSLLTGEALPVSCKAGEEVPGGAVNRGAPVRLQVRRRWADSTLASLTRMAERSALVRPRLAQLSERVASGFVTTLLIFSAGVWVAWLGIDADRGHLRRRDVGGELRLVAATAARGQRGDEGKGGRGAEKAAGHGPDGSLELWKCWRRYRRKPGAGNM